MGYTCFRITRAVRTLEDALLKETMLTKKAFHKKAFDDFLRGERIIDSDLKVTKRTADGYIKRSVVFMSNKEIAIDIIKSMEFQEDSQGVSLFSPNIEL